MFKNHFNIFTLGITGFRVNTDCRRYPGIFALLGVDDKNNHMFLYPESNF